MPFLYSPPYMNGFEFVSDSKNDKIIGLLHVQFLMM